MNSHRVDVNVHLSLSGHAEGRVIANFALQHLRAACTFRDQVVVIESQNTNQAFGPFFEDIRSYASACIMSAATSLEAYINELFIAPEAGLRSMLHDFESEFWGKGGIEMKPPLAKYQIALKMLGKPEFDRLSTPFRAAWGLVELRNALVHYKPTWDPDRKRKIELVEILAGKYELSPFTDEGADFVTMKSMSGGCARWSIATTLAFLKEFHAVTNLETKKMSAFLKLDS